MAVAHVNAKHRVFVLPDGDGAISSVVPGCRRVAMPDGPMVVVPHVREAVRFARNLGHRVPAPILSQYGWPPDTFYSQRLTAALLTMNSRAYVLSEIGTGKTRAALHALDFLLLTGEIERALIVAPLSTLSRVWETEVFRHFPNRVVRVLHGSREVRRKILAEPAEIYVINYDGVETILPELKAAGFGAAVVDELSYYRNSQTDLWKSAQALLPGIPYVWGMTGSPTPNEPSDAYGEVKLLTPSRVPKYFGHFRDQVMTKVSQFRYVPKPTALDTVYEVMQPAVRFLRKDVVELPETSYQTREVALGQKQTVVYNALYQKAHYAFASGAVTAVNEGVLLSKLLQVACGYVYTTTRATVVLDGDDRLQALLALHEEAAGKTIVFAGYIHAAEAVFRWLGQKGTDSALVTGATSLGERNRIFGAFQDTASPRVLVAHPGCMSHGLTLTAADTIVWFTPAPSFLIYEQANGRITRPGQKNKTLVVHLCATPVERKIYSRFQKKEDVQGALLEMFEQQEV